MCQFYKDEACRVVWLFRKKKTAAISSRCFCVVSDALVIFLAELLGDNLRFKILK
jgi:hypothetical protein